MERQPASVEWKADLSVVEDGSVAAGEGVAFLAKRQASAERKADLLVVVVAGAVVVSADL